MGLIRRIDDIHDDVLELTYFEPEDYVEGKVDFRELQEKLKSIADHLEDVRWDLDRLADKLRD